MFFNELVTVYEVRSKYSGITGDKDDAMILDFIREISAQIQRGTDRSFVPRIETRRYDPTRDCRGNRLVLDRDYLAFTTITNGDGNVVTSTQYVTEPRNNSPYWAIQLLGSTGLTWQYQTDPENAISILGVTGYHLEYADAWLAVDTLGGNISTTTETSLTLTTADSVRAGQLVQIDGEYLYIGAVSGTSVSRAARGANGSTAAAHTSGTVISVWQPDYRVRELAREAVTGLFRLKNNPMAESYTADDGTTFVTPKDVSAYVEKRMRAWGLVRI